MIQQFLPALEAEIKQQSLGDSPQELYDPIRYLMQLGGKRIRPVLCLLSYSLFKADWEKVVSTALSIEIFHNFTLMHDDIMDKAPLRRGKQTVHEKWNINTGILSGDAMLILAYQFFEVYEPNIFQKLAKLFTHRLKVKCCCVTCWQIGNASYITK